MTTNGTDLTEAFAKAIDGIPGYAFARLAEAVGIAPYEEHSSMHENSQRVAQAVVAAVHSASPSRLEAQREAASKAIAHVVEYAEGTDGPSTLQPGELGREGKRYLTETYPLPAPAGITLSNGDVVRYEREGLRGFHRTGSITVGCNTDPAFYLLNDSDTIGDQKALKAYAAEQSEAR